MHSANSVSSPDDDDDAGTKMRPFRKKVVMVGQDGCLLLPNEQLEIDAWLLVLFIGERGVVGKQPNSVSWTFLFRARDRSQW
jgi:hypothetical protein